MYVQVGSLNPATVTATLADLVETAAAEDWIMVRDGASISAAAFEDMLTTDELIDRIRDGLITEVVRYDPTIERAEALETVGEIYADQFTLEERSSRW